MDDATTVVTYYTHVNFTLAVSLEETEYHGDPSAYVEAQLADLRTMFNNGTFEENLGEIAATESADGLLGTTLETEATVALIDETSFNIDTGGDRTPSPTPMEIYGLDEEEIEEIAETTSTVVAATVV